MSIVRRDRVTGAFLPWATTERIETLWRAGWRVLIDAAIPLETAMKRPTRIFVAWVLVVLSVGFAVLAVLAMRSVLDFEKKMDAESHDRP